VTIASAGWRPSGGAAATAPRPPWSPSRSARRCVVPPQSMMRPACPETQVSSPRSDAVTFAAAAGAAPALPSSHASVSPMRSRARCTWPCQRRHRTRSSASASRTPSSGSPGVSSGHPSAACATWWARLVLGEHGADLHHRPVGLGLGSQPGGHAR
jgi:hypothetical protein